MTSNLLNSVVAITSQRDTDALAYSVIVTLAELIDCHDISILQQRYDSSLIKALLHLDISHQQPKTDYVWNKKNPNINPTLVKECINKGVPTAHLFDGLYVYYFCVTVTEHQSIVLRISSNVELAHHFPLINGLLLIYKNYQAILEDSEHDKLTGLLNRHSFERRISRISNSLSPQEHGMFTNDNDSTWLAMIDIDFFKRINDTYGHVCGDEILLIVAQKMQSFFSSKNLLFRFGGEEFVIVLERMEKEQAQVVLDNFRLLIEKNPFPFGEQLTISIGFSELSSLDFPTTIIDQADKALYHAKEHGRNKVCDYHTLVEQGQISTQQPHFDIELF